MDCFLFLLFLMAVPYSYCLPMHDDSYKPADVRLPEAGNGKCLTLNGVEIKSGEWMAVENCTMNCTCQKTRETEFMYCTPWCHIERTICREADIKSKVEYFEEVGKTGCKRCSAKVCDAIIPDELPNASGVINSTSVNKTHRTDGKFEILEETVVIFEKPKRKINDAV